MLRKILDFLIIITFLSAFSLVGLVAYWLFIPYDLITFNAPYATLQPIYHPGDILTISVDVTQKTDNVSVTVYRSLQDGFIFNFTENPTYQTKKGRYVYINETTIIPKEIMPGFYRFKTVSVFHVNPIRDIIVTKITNEFEIVK